MRAGGGGGVPEGGGGAEGGGGGGGGAGAAGVLGHGGHQAHVVTAQTRAPPQHSRHVSPLRSGRLLMYLNYIFSFNF